MFRMTKHHCSDDDWQEEDGDEDDCQNEGDDTDEDDESPEVASILQRDLERLSDYFDLWVVDDHRFIIIRGVKLPPMYGWDETDLFLEIPADYPYSPPGIGNSRVYVSPHLRFSGRILVDLHPSTTPKNEAHGFGPWAWLCYEEIHWNPTTDNLVKFVEMVRADLTYLRTH